MYYLKEAMKSCGRLGELPEGGYEVLWIVEGEVNYLKEAMKSCGR